MSHRVCVGMLALRNMCAEDTGDRELRTQKEQQIASTRAVTCSKGAYLHMSWNTKAPNYNTWYQQMWRLGPTSLTR